jgi:hypothetical protein
MSSLSDVIIIIIYIIQSSIILKMDAGRLTFSLDHYFFELELENQVLHFYVSCGDTFAKYATQIDH